jgi:hypothetical protein
MARTGPRCYCLQRVSRCDATLDQVAVERCTAIGKFAYYRGKTDERSHGFYLGFVSRRPAVRRGSVVLEHASQRHSDRALRNGTQGRFLDSLLQRHPDSGPHGFRHAVPFRCGRQRPSLFSAHLPVEMEFYRAGHVNASAWSKVEPIHSPRLHQATKSIRAPWLEAGPPPPPHCLSRSRRSGGHGSMTVTPARFLPR